MDLSGPSAQVLNTNPRAVNDLVLGKSSFTETNEAFAARNAALLAKMNARKNPVDVTTGKTVFAHAVDNRVLTGAGVPTSIQAGGFTKATAFSAIGFDLSPSVNSRLIAGTVPTSEYLKEIKSPLSTQTMTARLIDLGASPREAARVTEVMKSNLIRSLETLPPDKLIGDKDIYSRMGNLKTGILGGMVKKSKGGAFGNAVKQLYANTTFSPSGKSSVAMNSTAPIGSVIDAIKKTKTSQAVLKPLEALRRMDPNYRIPVRLDANGNITAYDRPEISKKTGQITSTRNVGVLNGDKFVVGRQQRGGGRKLTVSKKAGQLASEQLLGTTKTGVVSGQTGTAKPTTTTVTGGAPTDRRVVGVGKGEAVLNKKTTSALKGGRTAFIPGLGRIRIAGADQGIPTGQKTGSTTVGAVSQSAQLSRAQLIAATEKISLKEAKRRIAAERKLTTSMEESTKAQMTTKERLTQFSSKAGVGIGAMSGLTIAASFAGGQVGEMAQKIMPFVFGLQGITMLLPLLANPWVAAIAAIAVVGGVFIKMAKDVENARKAGVDLAKSMNMTSDKLQGLAETTGTVSASEEANRKREGILTGEDAVQRKFGQNILGSDFGKGLLADIEKQAEAGQGIQDIGRNISNSLAYAIVQGVITTDQAKSISSALGEELKSYEIPAIVSGRLTTLLGPNGENLATDPLKVTIAIQEESMTRQADFFKTALENIKPTVGLSATQTILGATGAGAVIGGGIGLAGGPFSPVTATGGAIAGGVVGAIGGVGAALSEKGARESNANLGAAALQLGLEQVSMNNGLVDSLNKQYDVKVKMAKTDKEIKKIEKERKAALDTLNAKNAEALNLLIAQKDNFGADIFTKGINAAIDTLYKDGPMKVFADEAKKSLESIKDADFKAMLQVQFASGSLDPVTIMKLANNQELQSKFTVLVEEQGSENANLVMQLLMKAGTNDTNLPIFMDIINKDPDSFDKNMKAISVLANMQQKYGITIDVNDDGATQIAEVVAITEKLAGITGEELTKEAFLDLGITGNMTGPEFDALWKTLVGTSKTINKSVIVDFVAAGDRNVLSAYLASQGITQLRGRGAASQRKAYLDKAKADLVGRQGKVDPNAIPGGTGGTGGDTGARDTTLDDILNRLKMVREQSIKATGGVKELLRVTGGKGLTQFGGVMQDLLKTPGGINREFLDFINQMDDKTRKIYLTEKNGTAILTGKGKALKEAYDEAIIGEYQYSQQESLDAAKGQLAALQKLKDAGVPTAQAVEMVADAQLAIAINGEDISSEELKRMAEDAKFAADELERVGVALKLATPAGKIEIVQGELSKANDYFDKQSALIEQQREAAPAYKALTSTIEKQTQAIEDANDEIDGYQSSIDVIQRELEVNAIYGSRVIDNLNAQVDILNRTAELDFDRPLANLSDESNILSNTLGLIDRAQDKINKKYDAQEEALSKISQLNSEIAGQEKQRLTLADALSQGDISAAAAAAQEMRATAAEAASRRSSGTLAAAREAEIGAVSVSGMTRVQIEERQFQIGQQTFALEQQRQIVEANIQRIQDAVYAKEQLRLPQIAAIQGYQDKIYAVQTLQLIPSQKILEDTTKAKEAYEKITQDSIDQLTYLTRTQEQWITINTELVAAESMNKKIEDETSASAIAAKDILDNWTKTKPKLDESIKPATDLKGVIAESATKSASILASWNALNKTFTTTHIINTVYTSSGGGGSTGGTGSGGGAKGSVQLKAYGGKIMPMNYGGMVPKYMAMGGAVGSDTVPAMLTPGEFVMNRAATKQFGAMLNEMNNSKFPSMIEGMTPAVYSSNNSSIVSPTITSVATTVSDNSSTMYNYNIGITVPQSSASSNDIARAVIGQIKYIDSQRIRGQK
jgi:hypothetical protein